MAKLFDSCGLRLMCASLRAAGRWELLRSLDGRGETDKYIEDIEGPGKADAR
jgi:hypothetical protein